MGSVGQKPSSCSWIFWWRSHRAEPRHWQAMFLSGSSVENTFPGAFRALAEFISFPCFPLGTSIFKSATADGVLLTFLLPHFFKKNFFFWCGLFLKSLLNLPQYCFCFLLGFFRPWGIWNLSSLTRDQTHTPWPGKGSLNQWSIREVPWHTSWVLRTHVITLGPTGESRINSLF